MDDKVIDAIMATFGSPQPQGKGGTHSVGEGGFESLWIKAPLKT